MAGAPAAAAGLGVAGLIAVALLGALPIAAAADRGEPWFDYRSFAESLGPDDPVRFSWTQSYGPITWPRDGNEVMRVVSPEPLYWKARNLDVFTNYAWTTRSTPIDPRGEELWALDMPEAWEDIPAWKFDIEVSIRRMRIRDVIGAGTTIDIKDASRAVEQATSPGTWDAPAPLRRGDSYTASVHVPRPTQMQLADATSRRVRAPGRQARRHGAVQAVGGQVDQPQRRQHHRRHQGRPDHRGRGALQGLGRRRVRPRRLSRPSGLGLRRRPAS